MQASYTSGLTVHFTLECKFLRSTILRLRARLHKHTHVNSSDTSTPRLLQGFCSQAEVLKLLLSRPGIEPGTIGFHRIAPSATKHFTAKLLRKVKVGGGTPTDTLSLRITEMPNQIDINYLVKRS